jgi:hypothetical protein
MEKANIQEPRDDKLRKRKSARGSPPFSKTKTGYVWLNVLPDDLWIKVREGETISEALQNEALELGGARSKYSLR